MNSNTIESDFGAAVRIEGLAGAAGSSLNVCFQGNADQAHAGNFATGLSIDWNGVLLANGISNGFHMTGNDSIGYSITTHGSALSQISIGNNLMYMDGDENIAVEVNTGGPTELVLGGNQIAFDWTGNTGFDLSPGRIGRRRHPQQYDHRRGGGATGMYFRSLNGPSTINVESNTLDFRGPGALIDRGIIFGTVTDTVTLDGSRNNSDPQRHDPLLRPGRNDDRQAQHQRPDAAAITRSATLRTTKPTDRSPWASFWPALPHRSTPTDPTGPNAVTSVRLVPAVPAISASAPVPAVIRVIAVAVIAVRVRRADVAAGAAIG